MLVYDTKREGKEKRDFPECGKRNEFTKEAPERMLPYDSIGVTQLFSPRIEARHTKKEGQVNCGRVCQFEKITDGHLEYDKDYIDKTKTKVMYNEEEIEMLNKTNDEEMIFDEKPLIVFESFGPDADQLLNIYRQSMQYEGHTLCILGINAENKGDNYGSVLALAKTLNDNLEATQKGNMQHKFKVVPFLWTPPGGAADQYYKVPYFEVRKMLMEVAKAMTEPVDNVVYRWIDRDVTNDTSVTNDEDIDSKVLRGLANSYFDGSDRVVTGIYNWNYIPRAKYDAGWNTFFENMTNELNRVEKELRSCFFQLRKRNRVMGSFYMPEPVLFMGKSAHNKAIGSLKNKVAKAGDNKQDGESLAAIPEEQIKKTRIAFSNEISVSKPVKEMVVEKFIGRQKVVEKLSYLHTLEKYFIDKKSDVREFYIALTNTRQTAFDNSFWNFISTSPYDKWYDLGTIEKQAEEELSEVSENDKNIIIAQLELSRKRNELANELFNRLNAIRPQ